MRLPLIAIGLGLATTASRADDAPPAPPEPPRGGTFQVGAGFSPDESFIATARVAHDNLFHTGQQLALDASVSAIHQRFGLDYRVPDLARTGLDLELSLANDRRELPGFARQGAGGSVGLARQIDRATRVFVRLRAEQVTATPDATTNLARAVDPTVGALPGDVQRESIVAVGAGATYATTDSAIPLHGTRLALYGERADPSLGSSVSLWSGRASFVHAEALGPLTLRVSGRAAYVGSSDPGGVPMSERLYFPGNGDVRGYAMSGSDRGANFLASGRVELEAPVWRRAGLALAGFYDAGVEGNRDPAFGPLGNTYRRAVGGSLIWRSPIGPLRFDLAVPLDDPKQPKRFLFWFGTAF